jgi:hypothetical protein
MELLTIHASKHGNWMETQDTSPTLTVTNANSLHKAGWDVHVTDSDGRRYGPMRFNEILSFARKPPIKFCFAAPRGETSRVTFGGTKVGLNPDCVAWSFFMRSCTGNTPQSLLSATRMPERACLLNEKLTIFPGAGTPRN